MEFLNPFECVIEAYKSLWGTVRCKISFDPKIRKRFFWAKWNCWGYTDFDEDPPVIKISAHLSVFHAVEILAHELAHLKCGENDLNHGRRWEETFDALHKETMKIIKVKQELYRIE